MVEVFNGGRWQTPKGFNATRQSLKGFNSKRQSLKGFTVVELILVVAIVAIVGSGSVGLYSRFANQNTVANFSDKLTGQLRKAQIYSMVSKNGGSWGVTVSSGKLVLFRGSSFATRTPALDENFTVDSNVALNGMNEVVFSKVKGTPSTALVVTVSGGGNSKTVTLNDQGVSSN